MNNEKLAGYIGNEILKDIVNRFPLLGPATIAMFEFNSKVKQKRINDFIQLLESELSELGFDFSKVCKEDKVDLFENVIKKVAVNRAEHKREQFRNILIRGWSNAEDMERCEVFTELLHSMSTKEIEILERHRVFLIQGESIRNKRIKLQKELQDSEARIGIDQGVYDAMITKGILTLRKKEDIQKDLHSLNELANRYTTECTPEAFKLSEGELRFFLQNLYGKGLLHDDGIGTYSGTTFTTMSLTEFGKLFLSYILR
jgi:hypothetical protein